MADGNNMNTEIVCDMVGKHVLDPEGDVILLFNSKHAIVSNADVVDLVKAEEDESKKYLLGSADIEVRVSSRHLSLKSPYFRALLSTKFAEGKKFQEHGSVTITLEDDPIHGAILLLQVLHLNLETPDLTPSLMMQVAFLVDKWCLRESLSSTLRQWWNSFRHFQPTEETEDENEWFYMVIMLGFEDEKGMWYRHILPRSLKVPHSEHLALHSIYKDMAEERLRNFKEISQDLSELVETYLPTEEQIIHCPNGVAFCDTALLGSIVSELKTQKLYPFPEEPYHDITLDDVYEAICDLKISSYCRESHRLNFPKKRKRDYPFSSCCQCCENVARSYTLFPKQLEQIRTRLFHIRRAANLELIEE